MEFFRNNEGVRQETRSAAPKVVFIQLTHPPSLAPVMSVWMLKIRQKNEDSPPPGKLQKRKHTHTHPSANVLNSTDTCHLDQRQLRSTAS